jgi:hypothetical protein
MNVRKAKGQLRMDNQETLAALSAGRTKRHWQHCRQDEPRDTGSIVCRTNQETLAALSAGRTKRHWQHWLQDEPRDTGSMVCRTNQETLAALSAGRRQTDKNTEHRKLIKRVTGTPSNNRG